MNTNFGDNIPQGSNCVPYPYREYVNSVVEKRALSAEALFYSEGGRLRHEWAVFFTEDTLKTDWSSLRHQQDAEKIEAASPQNKWIAKDRSCAPENPEYAARIRDALSRYQVKSTAYPMQYVPQLLGLLDSLGFKPATARADWMTTFHHTCTWKMCIPGYAPDGSQVCVIMPKFGKAASQPLLVTGWNMKPWNKGGGYMDMWVARGFSQNRLTGDVGTFSCVKGSRVNQLPRALRHFVNLSCPSTAREKIACQEMSQQHLFFLQICHGLIQQAWGANNFMEGKEVSMSLPNMYIGHDAIVVSTDFATTGFHSDAIMAARAAKLASDGMTVTCAPEVSCQKSRKYIINVILAHDFSKNAPAVAGEVMTAMAAMRQTLFEICLPQQEPDNG